MSVLVLLLLLGVLSVGFLGCYAVWDLRYKKIVLNLGVGPTIELSVRMKSALSLMVGFTLGFMAPFILVKLLLT